MISTTTNPERGNEGDASMDEHKIKHITRSFQ